MKYAICNETFQDWPFDRAFAFAREAGYTGIEIAPFTLARYATEVSSQRRGEVQRQIESAGLEMVGLHWLLAKTEGLYLTSPEKVVRLRTADYLTDLARLCSDLGGSIMVLGSPQQRNLLRGVTKPQGMQYAADVITMALAGIRRMRRDAGRRAAGPSEGDFLLTAAEGRELIELIASPQVRCTWIAKRCRASRSRFPKLSRPTAI